MTTPTRLTSRRAALQTATWLAIGSGLAACVGGSSAEPPRTFYLSPLATPPPGLPKVDWSLVVEPPQTVPALRTNRIALAFAPNEFDYIAGAEWGDQAPLMVQALIIRSLQTSKAIEVVANERQRLRPDFVLRSSLAPFFAQGPVGSAPDARVGLDAQLVQMRGREVVGTTAIEHSVKADGPEIEAIIAAFDRALAEVLNELLPWVLETGQAHVGVG